MSNMDVYSFGELLTTLRKQRRISQNDLAEKLDVHRNTIGKWERGIGLPESKTIVLELAKQLRLNERETKQLLEASLTAVSSYWNMPYQRNPFFTGRSPILEHLHTMLTHESTIAALTQSYALHGMGGIGKTQLAIEYAYQHRSEYDAILWVEAETQTTLVFSFITIAALLTLPEKMEEDQNKVVAAVLRWLNRHKGWLLVFDNVEDLSLLKPFLPANDQGALLLTTRLQSLGTLAQRVELPLMTMQEGCDFLLTRINHLRQSEEDVSIDPQEIAVAQQIVAEMRGLPLALEQAGAYIDATQYSLSDYLHLFQAVPHHLLEEHEPSSGHPLSVSRTFALAFERVEQHNPLAAALLTICAFLASDAIPETFFLEGASSLGSTFEALETDPLAFPEAIKMLLSYSLLQRHATTRTITIHRLVQVVLKGRFTETVQRAWTQRVVEVMNRLFPADEEIQADYLSACERLLPHAQACLLLAEQWTEDETLYIPLMSHVATYLARRARYTEAKVLFDSALRMGEQAVGSEHPLVAEALHGLAELYRVQGQYEEAKSLFERAIRIREQTLEAGHPLIAAPLWRLGNIYRRQGKYEQAEALYERALCILEQAVGSDHLQMAYPLNGLGLIYYEQGKYEQAEALYERAFHIREQAFGPDHSSLAPPLNNLGNIYKQQGKYEEAEPLYQQSLYIFEQTFGPNYSDVAYPLHNLGELYFVQGKYEQAEPLYLRALHIWEQALGSEHSDVAYPLNNLGELYFAQGKFEQAEPLYKRGLHIREQAFGPDHPLIADSLNSLANLYRELDRYNQAESFYGRALVLRQQHLGPAHPDVAETLHDLARLYQLQQQTAEALSLYQQALAIREQALGQEHPKTQKTCSALTLLLQEMVNHNMK